jgi:hypothetical protein
LTGTEFRTREILLKTSTTFWTQSFPLTSSSLYLDIVVNCSASC